MSFLAIIPARAASSRLPGKPLLDIAGLPMVVRTARQAALSQAARVLIATDHPDILACAKQYGIEAMLTATDHASGTDRLAEVVTRLGLADHAVVVNVQGDEPLIEPALIDAVAELLARAPDSAMATCAAPFDSASAALNPNNVKVVCDFAGRALYFSRAPIAWDRERQGPALPGLQHIGLYAYRAGFLRRFPSLSPGRLEQAESLEQLRALEHGFAIQVLECASHPAQGVDTAEDLAAVRALCLARDA